MIIIFTGNGKGKTSAAIGTSLRAISGRKRTFIIQFLKTGDSGEILFLKKFSKCNIKTFGKKKFVDPKKPTTKDFELAKKALEFTQEVISKKPFLIILDEILVALKFKLIHESVVLDIIETCKKKRIHLILTGISASKKIIDKADLVTEMRNIKHPFEKGKRAVKGIDY